MKVFLVTVEDYEGRPNQTVCKSDSDLVALINNIDKQIYEITSIKTIENWTESFVDFCAKPKGLETGTTQA